MIKNILLVGTGSFAGGILRYLVSILMKHQSGFPWATFRADKTQKKVPHCVSEKKLSKREQYDENLFSIILPSVKFLAVGKLRTSCLIKSQGAVS